MQCPSCAHSRLQATRLDHGLPALGCVDCGGALVPLLAYRDWVDRTVPVNSEPDLTAITRQTDQDSRRALRCPKCSGLMTKYRIQSDQNNRLDLCDHCDEAWLDGGEWALLKALQLSDQLPKIFTEAWQHRISHEQGEQQLINRFKQRLGEADLAKAAAFRDWLNDHEKRADLLFFINQQKSL